MSPQLDDIAYRAKASPSENLRHLPPCAWRRKLLPHSQRHFDPLEARVTGL